MVGGEPDWFGFAFALFSFSQHRLSFAHRFPPISIPHMINAVGCRVGGPVAALLCWLALRFGGPSELAALSGIVHISSDILPLSSWRRLRGLRQKHSAPIQYLGSTNASAKGWGVPAGSIQVDNPQWQSSSHL